MCDKELFNIYLNLYIYFFQKLVKMILENHSLKGFWTAYDMLFQIVYIIFHFIYMT